MLFHIILLAVISLKWSILTLVGTIDGGRCTVVDGAIVGINNYKII